jgi:DNA-binding NtrC family response regulator
MSAQKPSKRAYDRTSFVLIVDDDDTLLKFFKIHLNKFFSRVIVVQNAKEAIDTMKEKEIDLIITDIRMPKIDGFQLLKRVREKDASIPVILISGALLDDQQLKEAQEFADGFLKKPFSVDDLHKTIDEGFDRRELLKKLAALITSNKDLLSLITGKETIEKVAKKAVLKEAKEIWDAIQKIGSTEAAA